MQDTFDRRKHALEKYATRQYNHAVRRLEACRQDLEVCQQWESLHHRGMLLQANLYRLKKGMHEIFVSDWLADGLEVRIALDPLLPPSVQIERIFRLSRKRKKAVSHLVLQVEKRQLVCAALQASLETLHAMTDDAALQSWRELHFHEKKQTDKKRSLAPLLPYHEFHSAAGLCIRVGKGAKSNDLLTFRHSKGSDWWLHVRDYAGSHVVLCVPKGQEPDEASLKDAMLLALAYSKACHEKEAEIAVTQCKHVHRFGDGMPGKVQLGMHKVVLIRHNAEHLKAVKGRKLCV